MYPFMCRGHQKRPLTRGLSLALVLAIIFALLVTETPLSTTSILTANSHTHAFVDHIESDYENNSLEEPKRIFAFAQGTIVRASAPRFR